MRALLVGAGNMGRGWAKNIEASDAELVGWVDVRPGVADDALGRLGLDNVYTGTDLKTAIIATQPDFVVDVSSPEAHYDVTMTALRAGLPVLGEKPLATSMEQAREMVAAAERAGKLFMVSQNRRYNANIRAMRRLVAQHLGPLGILSSDFFIGAHFGGFREEMPHPLLLDMAIHTFDAARYISGADAMAVYCEEFNSSWSWYQGSASAVALFEMTGGLRYTYQGSWSSEGGQTPWEAEWRAVGPHGTATWNGWGPPSAEVVAGPPEGLFARTELREVNELAEVPYGIAGSLRDFLHALETGATPLGECHDNIKSLAMVFAAIESATTCKRVPVTV